MLLSIIRLLMLIIGIVVLVSGEVALSKTRKVTGPRARIIGGILLAPFPLSFAMGFMYGFYGALSGETIDREAPILVALSLVPVLGCSVAAVVLGVVWTK